jgi:hypothetical protein
MNNHSNRRFISKKIKIKNNWLTVRTASPEFSIDQELEKYSQTVKSKRFLGGPTGRRRSKKRS